LANVPILRFQMRREWRSRRTRPMIGKRCATSRDLGAASLVSQGHHGINARGPPGGYVAGDQCHNH
jgi:hypothetical protein